MIKEYCKHNNISVISLFLEYKANDFHTTHTQCFVELNDRWFEFLDNSSNLDLHEIVGGDKAKIINSFINDYELYLKYILKDEYLSDLLFIKEYDCSFERGMSDLDFLSTIKKGND